MILPFNSPGHEKRIGITDVDIAVRPRGYMPMRFLAWSLTKIDDETPMQVWVNRVRKERGLDDKKHDPTFVLSLIGILHDLTTQEKKNPRAWEITIAARDLINEMIERDGQADK